MNFKEKKIRRRVFSRLAGDKAAVYLEFAMSFPLLLGISLFILEMLMFWDASVMANHAAFTVARIAKVHYYQSSVTSEDDPYPKVRIGGKDIPADKLVLSFFMMSSTYSWFSKKSEDLKVNFYDYFRVTKPLFSISCGDNANIFQKMLVSLLKSILNPIDEKVRDFTNNKIDSLLDRIFGSSSSQMNTRFNMALQRAMLPGTLKTDLVSIPGKMKFPSDDYSTDGCESPEAAKVTISYPLFKGGWLYSFFLFWKLDNDKQLDAVRLSSRWAFFAEPERELKDYFANDDGSSDIDPDDLKKRARKRAKKIIDETSTLIDEWEKAVIARENLGNKHGKNAPEKKDYQDACKHEAKLWSQIKQKIHDFMNIIESPPKKGGLCGNQSDNAGVLCQNNPTKFTKCARNEMQKNLPYCVKVVSRIRTIAGKHTIWHGQKIKKGNKLIFKGYVPKDNPGLVYPGHKHGILNACGTQHFCP